MLGSHYIFLAHRYSLMLQLKLSPWPQPKHLLNFFSRRLVVYMLASNKPAYIQSAPKSNVNKMFTVFFTQSMLELVAFDAAVVEQTNTHLCPKHRTLTRSIELKTCHVKILIYIGVTKAAKSSSPSVTWLQPRSLPRFSLICVCISAASSMQSLKMSMPQNYEWVVQCMLLLINSIATLHFIMINKSLSKQSRSLEML